VETEYQLISNIAGMSDSRMLENGLSEKTN